MPDRTIPGVLDPQERRAVEGQFGVGARQVVRDHVISHGLAAIAVAAQGDVVFFGGTALSRTLLPCADTVASERPPAWRSANGQPETVC